MRQLNPGIKVAVRLFAPDLARRVEKGFGIQTASSTSALAAPIFAAAAVRANVKYSFYVGGTLLSLSQLTLGPDSALIGWQAHKLESELDMSVACYQGQDKTDFRLTCAWLPATKSWCWAPWRPCNS